MDKLYHILYIVVLLGLGFGLLLGLIRTIRGPRIADRIIGVNIIGTLGSLAIVILALLLAEGFIMDVALIYCLISFLSVIVLARIYISTGATRECIARTTRQEDTDE